MYYLSITGERTVGASGGAGGPPGETAEQCMTAESLREGWAGNGQCGSTSEWQQRGSDTGSEAKVTEADLVRNGGVS